MWNEQPAGKDHPWRYMPFHAMTPHTSGVTIDAQVLQNASSSHYIMDYYTLRVMSMAILGSLTHLMAVPWKFENECCVVMGFQV